MSSDELKRIEQQLSNLKLENKDTNMDIVLPYHLSILANNKELLRTKSFSDIKTYHKVCAAYIMYLNVRYSVFQKNNTEIEEDFYDNCTMPSLPSFWDIESKTIEAMNGIKYGDVLNLLLIDDNKEDESRDYFLLKIINKCGDSERLLDYSLHVRLLKKHELVRNINPPLAISDLVRAAVFGKVEESRVVTLNPKYISNKAMENLKLGRITERDLPNFQDAGQINCLGKYLEQNIKGESSDRIAKHIAAYGCDASQTAPLYKLQNKKRKIVHPSYNLPENLISAWKKAKEAEELLLTKDLKSALLKIDESLMETPLNEKALVLRGKIYFEMGQEAPSAAVASKLKRKALLDIVAALKRNCFHEEAILYYNKIIQEAIEYTPEYAKELTAALRH